MYNLGFRNPDRVFNNYQTNYKLYLNVDFLKAEKSQRNYYANNA